MCSIGTLQRRHKANDKGLSFIKVQWNTYKQMALRTPTSSHLSIAQAQTFPPSLYLCIFLLSVVWGILRLCWSAGYWSEHGQQLGRDFFTRTLKIPLSYIVMLHIYTFYRSIYLYSMSYFFISISIIQ